MFYISWEVEDSNKFLYLHKLLNINIITVMQSPLLAQLLIG